MSVPPELLTLARSLMRETRLASLATATSGGQPHCSLVEVAADVDGVPLLMLSALAEHTRLLSANPLACLLLEGERLAGQGLDRPRLALQGVARRAPDPAAGRERYLAAHPEARGHAGLADFAIWRVEPRRAHLVAGFGRVLWIPAADLLGA